jgi:putative pyrroloquinoline-quinone binding quinoprotein
LDASVAWQYDFTGLQQPSTNPPAVANGVVYIAAGQQGSTYMFALRASNGGLVFKSQMSSQWEYYLAPTIGASGVYTNAGTYGGLYGFDTSGNLLFFDGVAQQDEWTPAVDATHVYAYTGDGLHIFDPVTGAVQMTITDPTFTNYVYDIGGSVVLGTAGHAVAAAYTNSLLNGCGIGNTLVGFNTTLGTINWKVPGCFPSNPAYHAGLLYIANQNPMQLEVRSEADGSIQWSWIPPVAADISFLSEALLTQNMVFISTNTAVYGIDTTTHQTVWSYPAAGGARLALSANGILYLQFGANGITAINVK